MELLLSAAAFYVWQCVQFLPEGGALFVGPARRVRAVSRGQGWRLLLPWPASLNLVLGGFPLEMTSRRAYFSSQSLADGEEQQIELDEAGSVESHGQRLVMTKTVLRTASLYQAGFLRRILQQMAAVPPAEREAAAQGIFGESVELGRFNEALEAVRRAIAPLRWSASLYVLLVFAVIPIVSLRFDNQVAWRFLLPAIGVVHLATLVAMMSAESQLNLAGQAQRFFVGALFPPALWCAPHELTAARMVSFHPATAAAALLDREVFVDFLRQELARLDSPGWKRHGGRDVPEAADREALLGRRREQLASLLGQLPTPLDELPRRAQADVTALSYCPLCLDDFRVEDAHCAACGVAACAYRACSVKDRSPSVLPNGP